MASTATVQANPESANQNELDRLAEDFFQLADEQLSQMESSRREIVISRIHTTAESLRAEK